MTDPKLPRFVLPSAAALAALLPAAGLGAQAPAAPRTASQPAAGTVPLSLFTNADWPNGFDFGDATGVSFSDWNGDGWVDLYACDGDLLWENVGGTTWRFAGQTGLPAGFRYGSSFGDYDADGLPDFGTEPRVGSGDDCLHLLHNLGNGAFLDVAGDPAIVDVQPCAANSETIAWADVDGDGDLDMFFPTYPASTGNGIDNKFFHNRGPSGPGGAFRFEEKAAGVGLEVPAGAARPEGTFWFDADGDGDLELYSNGHLYLNTSGLDAPDFTALAATESGIRKRNIIDEGAYFLDYDLDGDYDLLISYTGTSGVRLWEARGDGSYFLTPETTIEDYRNGSSYGLSVADWDGDGDLDCQTLTVFRRNLFVETGAKGLALAPHSLPNAHLSNTAAAWGDWDRDGDPDFAAATGGFDCMLYRNDVYGPATPAADKRHVRVRALTDSTSVTEGIEGEYGASLALIVRGDESRPRKALVSSASGYVNQNEYDLTLFLPPDPFPADPEEDVRFELVADLPSLPAQGYRRIDKFVNPALGGLHLAELGAEREVQVFRSGKAVVRGVTLAPQGGGAANLLTSTGGLASPAPGVILPPLTAAAAGTTVVGLELETLAAAGPLGLQEIVLDGVPAAPVVCGAGTGNAFLWDVTNPASPVLASDGVTTFTLAGDNHRGHYRTDMVLQPGRRYRLVALVESWRESPARLPLAQGPFRVRGGLRAAIDPCNGLAVAGAPLMRDHVQLAVRLRTGPRSAWVDLGAGTAAGAGTPALTGSGAPRAGGPVQLALRGAAPNARVTLVVGTSVACDRARGVVVVPDADLVLRGIRTDAAGNATLNGAWPAGHARGTPLFVQVFVADTSAASGFAASNALGVLSEG